MSERNAIKIKYQSTFKAKINGKAPPSKNLKKSMMAMAREIWLQLYDTLNDMTKGDKILTTRNDMQQTLKEAQCEHSKTYEDAINACINDVSTRSKTNLKKSTRKLG